MLSFSQKHLRILALAFLLVPLSACTPDRDVELQPLPLPVLAVFPFVNHTQSGEAASAIMPILCERIGAQGLPCITDTDLRPILRQHRIRSGGMLTRDDVTLIGDQTNASVLLLGSIDFFNKGENPELGLSVRVLDVASLEVLFARSVAITGTDFSGMFGIGKRDTIEELLDPLVEELLLGLDPDFLRSALNAGPGSSRGPSLALVAFENRSEYALAGNIFTGILFSELFESGFHIIDPALLNAVYIDARRAMRGAVDLPIVRDMREDLDADWILTGSVNLFKAETGDLQSTPELEVHARMLKADEGRLVFKFDETRRGTPSAQVIGFEERHSLGRLAAKTAASLGTHLATKIEDEFEH